MAFQTQQLVLLGVLWLGYFSLHSALAALPLKRWVAARYSGFIPFYRIAFNSLALLLLLPPLWMLYRHPGPVLWQWPGYWGWLANLSAAGAVVVFAWSLRYYDNSEFWGLRQWRQKQRRVEDQERLTISPLHRHVRHPWYSLGLLLLWTRDMNAAMLLSALAISLYFIIGSRLEERRLVCYYGDAYKEYRNRVPALIPLPWRRLDPESARAIEIRASLQLNEKK